MPLRIGNPGRRARSHLNEMSSPVAFLDEDGTTALEVIHSC